MSREASVSLNVIGAHQEWSALLLRRGAVLPQLTFEFEDEQIPTTLVETYQLPAVLDDRRFWQLMLRPKEM
ncbi:MAG: hypothetical protein JWL61_1522 [Gemmatimonadetes bacterium]|nr:hypothetical protein [Gemmatimonadota bacterium]